MLKSFSQFFTYCLLVLLPLQAVTAANMLVCSATIKAQLQTLSQSPTIAKFQSHVDTRLADVMPCHQKIAIVEAEITKDSPCKANCAAVCANMNAVIAKTTPNKSNFALNTSQNFSFYELFYVSISQPQAIRPPISFI